jgi:hypothetical protein
LLDSNVKGNVRQLRPTRIEYDLEHRRQALMERFVVTRFAFGEDETMEQLHLSV